MKEYILNEIRQIESELQRIKVANMKLSDRIAYERALLRTRQSYNIIYRFLDNA